MNRLKELHKDRKLTQAQLADKIGVSKITILRWENNERQIKDCLLYTSPSPRDS